MDRSAPTPPTERERAIHAVVLGFLLGLAMAVLARSATHRSKV
ncbi:MAG TPA: hypothetical protein VI341_07155 [Actinomycetota bacterium]